MDWTIPPAGNKYGHSASIAAKLPPELYREIQAFVQSGRFPYKTNSDLVRHAVLLQCRALAEMEPGVAQTDLTDVLIEITRIEIQSQRNLAVIDDAVIVLEDHLTRGRVDDARRFYANVYSLALDMPEGEMQEQALNRLEKFDHLRPKGVVSLRPTEAL